MSFINFRRNINGRVSLGNLPDEVAAKKPLKDQQATINPKVVRDYQNIIGKKSTPKVADNDLNSVFNDLDLKPLTKK